MALSKEERELIKAQLRLGKSPKDLAEMYNCNVQQVYTIRRKLETEKENETVQTLMDAPVEVVKHVAEEVKKQVPEFKANELVDGVDGLKKLDMRFQSTMMRVLTRFDEVLENDDLKISEIKVVADTVANAYNKVFASGTNIHIGDNNHMSNQRLTIFKSKQGV